MSRTWDDAAAHCASVGLRLPSVSEAITMAKNFDVPGVSAGDIFWADDESYDSGTPMASLVKAGVGAHGWTDESDTEKTVCGTDPSA